MIDEKKVALMTKLEIFENKERDRSLVMSKYYKNDYVRYNVLKTIVAATVVYWLAIGMYAYMGFDDILAKINNVDYFGVMYKLLGGYVMFCVVYYLFATLVYNFRYMKAKKGLIKYNVNLKKLIELEGGNVRGKLVKNSDLSAAVSDAVTDFDEPEDNMSGADESIDDEDVIVAKPTPARNTVSRSDMIKQRLMEEEKRKEQEIIENVRRRNERIAAQNEEKLRQERLAEQEKKKIQERRKQLEREQMERIRNERMNQVERENHEYMYSQNDNNHIGGDK